MNKPIVKFAFDSMTALQSDDAILLSTIPPFLTLSKNNGDNSWEAELKSRVEAMYNTARGVKCTVTVIASDSRSGIVRVDPDDKVAYEISYTVTRAISEF